MEKYKIFSGSALKTIALITMMIDHVAHGLLINMDFAVTPFLTIGSVKISIYLICRLIGRIAFPIYCFLITEGFIHTHDKRIYGANLLGFALISEIPWNLEHTGTFLYSSQNVFFTLFLGFFALCIYDRFKGQFGKLALSLGAVFIVAILLRADYGVKGVAIILLMYLLRQYPVVQAFCCSAPLNYPFASIFAFVPINMYNGERGFINNKVLKYIYYAAYPLHLLIIWMLR